MVIFFLLNPDIFFFANSVDPDQLVKLYMLMTGNLRVNWIKIKEECRSFKYPAY